jgi:hypothetical protein
VLLDTSTFRGRTLFANAKKRTIEEGQERRFGGFGLGTTPKETFFVTSSTGTYPSPFEFDLRHAHFSGKVAAPLQLRPVSGSEYSGPRTITGRVADTVAGVNGLNQLATFAATFDTVRTQRANVSKKTLEETAADLRASYVVEKGYTDTSE